MKKNGSLWDRSLKGRISRRRALGGAVALGTGAAAVSLVGCGGGGGGGNGKTGVLKPGEIGYTWQLPDENDKAVPGGIYRSSTTYDTGSMDPMTSSDFATQSVAGAAYETLLGFEFGPGMDPTYQRKVMGRLAESYEVASDATMVTFKLRPNVKFHNVAPVNGRTMELEDWRQSLTRFLAVSPYKANLRDIIDKAEYPDAQTMVLKLKTPYAPATSLFTSGSSSFWVMPKEASDGSMDPKTKAIGTYYMILDKAQSSVTWEYRRHPEFWRGQGSPFQGRPFIDRWHYPIIPEYSQRLAQFLVGNILEWTPRRTDVLQNRKDTPDALMYQTDVSAGYDHYYFGQKDYEKAPWRDERVRQALSMSMPREKMRRYFSNRVEFEAAGLPVETRWQTHVRCTRTGFWLDPQKDEFGENATYFKYDPAEAKKLVLAAGYPNGIGEMTATWTDYFGPEHNERMAIMSDALDDSGIVKIKRNVQPYPTALRDFYLSRDFYGITSTPDFTEVDVDLELYSYFHSKGSRTKMVEVDPKVDDFIMRQRTELDASKRFAIVQDFQKYMAKKMYTVPVDGGSSGFTFKWPWIRNSVWPGWNEFLSADMPRRNSA